MHVGFSDSLSVSNDPTAKQTHDSMKVQLKKIEVPVFFYTI